MRFIFSSIRAAEAEISTGCWMDQTRWCHKFSSRLPSSTTILTRSQPQRYISVIFCLIPRTGKLKCSQPLPRMYPHYQPTPPLGIQPTASQPYRHFQLMFPIEECKLAKGVLGFECQTGGYSRVGLQGLKKNY